MRRLERLAAILFGGAFIMFAFAVAAETTLRRAFNHSLQGVDEFGGYVFAVVGTLSLAVAVIERTHIRIDIVHDHLPRSLRIILNVVAVFSIAACAISIVVMAVISLKYSVSFNSTTQTPWATPLRYPQFAWVAALGLFLVVCIVETVRILRAVLSGHLDEIDRTYGPRGSREELKSTLEEMNARRGMTQTSPKTRWPP